VRVVLVLTGVTLAAGMLSKGACVQNEWGDGDRAFAELCWTELADLSTTRGTTPAWASYVDLSPSLLAVLLAPLALLGAWLVTTTRPTARCGAGRWAGAAWAVSPVLLTQWLSWELIAAAALAGLLWTAARGQWLLAGACTAIAAACSPWAVRSPLAVDIGSWWLVVEQRRNVAVSSAVVAVVLVVSLLAVAAALAVLARSGRLTLAAGLTLGLVALVLVAPSGPPEVALLLLPGAALAVRRWRDLLAWQACEVVSWAITGWYLGGVLAPSTGGDATTYWAAVGIRTIGLLWLAGAVLWRDPPTDSSGERQEMTTRSNAVAV
jgi:hypothetical protein